MNDRLPGRVRGRAPGDRTASSAKRTQLLLVAYAVLSLAAAAPLYLDSERTDRSFAWTIEPPLTAAFLGAAYASSFAMYALAAHDRVAGQVRALLPAGLVFTALMLAATLLHLDRFHLDAAGLLARTIAWLWLLVYVSVPLVTAWFVLRERPPAGRDDDAARLAGWRAAALAVQAGVAVALGGLLIVGPTTFDAAWPWTLTPLTARAVGAWLVGIGVIGAHAAWRRVVMDVRPILLAWSAFAVLQGIALARYGDTLDAGDLRTWLYVAFLTGMFAVAVAGLLPARARGRPHVA